MRVKNEQVVFLKQSIKKYLPKADVYLIGSRANDKLKGGDIDILAIYDASKAIIETEFRF